MTTPADVVRAARGYLDTSWRHQGRTRAGLDCAGLVVRVAHDLELSRFDTRNYARVPSGDAMRKLMREHCIELPADRLTPGLVALMRFEREPQHLAIVADYVYGGPSIVHALLQARRVVEHRLDDTWRARIVGLYALPGVEYPQ